jgi:hypothetical protein
MTTKCGNYGCTKPAEWYVNDGPEYGYTYLCDDCYRAAPIRFGWQRLRRPNPLTKHFDEFAASADRAAARRDKP